MYGVASDKRIKMPNLLLIFGNGRNVGKTYLARSIITRFSKNTSVIGVKISPHFHPFENKKILFKSDDFVIIEEDQINRKDSSLMLQAGAEKVYFVMSEQKNLKKAFLKLQDYLPETAIVCESGGLIELVNPGLGFFVNKKDQPITKNKYDQFAPIMVINNEGRLNFDINSIHFKNNRFSKIVQ